MILLEITEYEMYVRVDVCSRGIKIEREEFPGLFQRFYRGRNAKEQEGVGIGLHQALEIIRGERGYMKGEYHSEQGNVFSIFLRKFK